MTDELRRDVARAIHDAESMAPDRDVHQADAAIAVIRNALEQQDKLTVKDFDAWYPTRFTFLPHHVMVAVDFANHARTAMLAASPLGETDD